MILLGKKDNSRSLSPKTGDRGFHRAWLILGCTVLIQGGIIGLLVNSAGVLFAAIRTDLGFRAGDLSVYYTIRQVVMAATVGITSQLFFRKNPRVVMGVLGFLGGSSFVMMAGFHHLWQWYGAAVLAGLGISCCTTVVPMVLNNWFASKRGLVVGISMSASGLVGACFSPVCSWLIESLGWRLASAITGTLAFAMAFLGCLILVAEPEKAGLRPYGRETEPTGDRREKAGSAGVRGNVPEWAYWVAVMALFIPNTYTQFNNQLPVFAQTVGYSLGTGAVLTSISMVGNITGKLGLGVLADKMGIYRAAGLLILVLGLSQAAFLFGADSLLLMKAGAFFYGTVYAMGTTAPSQVFLAMYGKEHYGARVRNGQTVNSFLLAFAGVLFPYVYDFTGSFRPVFYLGAGICILSLGLLYVVSGAAGRELQSRQISVNIENSAAGKRRREEG